MISLLAIGVLNLQILLVKIKYIDASCPHEIGHNKMFNSHNGAMISGSW